MSKIFSENDLKKIKFSIFSLKDKNDLLILGCLKGYDNKERYYFDSWLDGNLCNLISVEEKEILHFKEEETICGCIFDTKNEVCHDLYVIPVFRHNGIASYMYKFIEEKFDILLTPSASQTDDGKMFWQNFAKKRKSIMKI